MDISSIPIPNPSAIFRKEIEEWGVLFNLDTAASLALNPTGAMIWKLILKQKKIVEIIEAVKSSFNNVPDSIGNDVTALIDLLTEEGFVGQEVKF